MARNLPRYIQPLALALLACVATERSSAGQDSPWHVQSPLPAQVIDDGELFISVVADPQYPLETGSVRVEIDGVDVTRKAKVSETAVRVVYTGKLGSGPHEVRVSARQLNGERMEALVWNFEVDGEALARAAARRPGRTLGFSGRTLIDTRNSDISGLRDLRQEPVRRYALRADAEGDYGAFTFPVRLYLSTDESAISQPRNRFSFGVEGPMFAVYGGDTNPHMSPLLLSGARTRGVHGKLDVGPFQMEALYGQLRRGLEGRSVDPTGELVRELPGTFKRSLTALKLGFGELRSVHFSMTGLKAWDDIHSIAYGQDPTENVALSGDLSVRALAGKLRFESGAAISLTTQDISRGVATKAEIDSLFDTDLPVDPADFNWIITVNSSTIPLRLDKLNSTAWYVKSRAVLPGNTLSAEWRTVGSAFFSAANPFLQSDRRTVTLTDRFHVLDGRASGLVRFQHYGSLPFDDARHLSLSSNLVEGRVNARSSAHSPTLTTGLRFQQRKRGDDIGETLTVDTHILTSILGVLHDFETGAVRHAVSGFWTRTARRDEVNSLFDNTTHAFSFGATEQYPLSIYSNVQITHLVVNYAGALDRQRWTNLAGTVGYRFHDEDATVSMTLRNTHAGATTFSSSSNRLGFTLSGSLRLPQNMTVELQAGYDRYREKDAPENRYSERFLVLRHLYTF